MKSFLLFLTGYVQIHVWGGEVGRFFNLCVRNQIKLWDVTPRGENGYTCMLRRNEIWGLHPYLRKTRTRIKVLKKKGLPFFLFRYRKRIIFPLVFLVASCLFGYFSRFIWKIELNGNSYVTEESMISYLESRNISFGTLKSKIDCTALELALREDFDNIIWTSISVEGTDLVIEIQEKMAETSSSSFDAGEELCYNIVAAKDATIDSIITRKGTPCVKAGDEVVAGQVLVEGEQIVLDDNGEEKLAYPSVADADVTGVVSYEYEDSIPVTETLTEELDSGISAISISLQNYYIEIPNPFWRKEENWKLWKYVSPKSGFQFPLPVSFGLCTSYVTEKEEHTVSEEEALRRAQLNLTKFISNLEKNGVFIVDKNIIMEEKKNEYQISGIINAKESIVELVPVSVSDRIMEGTETNELE